MGTEEGRIERTGERERRWSEREKKERMKGIKKK